MEHDNENEPLSFLTLGALTANVTRYLVVSKDHQADREKRTGKHEDDKQKTEDEARYIEHRLRELREWERRISGGKRH